MENTKDSDALAESRQSVSEPRRKLTRAALAAPVVLGTLASKQALGNVPYQCTVSGVLSNNMSVVHQGGNCSTLGLSPGCWKQNDVNWARKTLFTSIFGSGGGVPSTATMIQVLCVQSYGKNGNPCSNGGIMPFARSAVANYLNATYLGAPANFPLTTSQVVAMFQAGVSTSGNGALPGQTDPNKTYLWYFTMLYGGSPSSVDGTNTVGCPHGATVPLDQQCSG